MRVITGSAKGRKLKAPKGMTTRPTTDRVKEALFSVLASKVEDARMLDLFAGSGGIGIEALSRGAQSVVFIEENPKVIAIINDNLLMTGLMSGAKVYRNDVYRGLEKLRDQPKFDIIFMDPPYEQGHEVACIKLIQAYNLLLEDGLVVVESSKRDELPEQIGDLSMIRSQHYGDTKLTYYSIQNGQA